MAAKKTQSAARKPRADALRNRERILEVAKEAFTRYGAQASLDDMARQAGVGAGTLYRHFPTREELLKEVYRSEMEKLAETEHRLAATLPPAEALRAWLLLFVEAIAAPDFTPTAQQLLIEKRKNCRLLRIATREPRDAVEVRSIRYGFLIQQLDQGDPATTTWKVVSERRPRSDELQAMQFAWKAVRYVKSNAIVIATTNATVGIGGGLPSRLDATQLAVAKAGARARGAALASDAFFPFPDAVEVAAQAGVACVVQPGGSLRDQEVIDAANRAGMVMVFTGVRHFRH